MRLMMVSVKYRTVKNRTYVYVAATASYRGRKKTFEKVVGVGDESGTDIPEGRIEFYSNLMEFKAELYKMYMEIEDTKLSYLPRECAIFLVMLPGFYRKYLAGLYPSELEKYRQNFDVRYVHNTTAIEGNTISLKETSMILDHNLSPRSKKLREVHEIENYGKVLSYMRNYEKDITKKYILELHRLIERNIDDNTAGNFRRISVGISGSKWEPVPAISVEEEIGSLLEWYRTDRKKIHPFELAGLFHHKFLQVHPFVDGNGRVGRELFNFILRRNGFPPVIVPVSRRDEYMECLELADEGDPAPLLRFFYSLLVADYVGVVRDTMLRETDKLSQIVGGAEDEKLTREDVMELFGILQWFMGLLGGLGGEVFKLEDVGKLVEELGGKMSGSSGKMSGPGVPVLSRD